MDEADVRYVMTLPWVATASDGGVKIDDGTRPHPRSFGTFPRKIGRYAIEEGVIPVEQAIRSATGLPADILGLTDRGLLKPRQLCRHRRVRSRTPSSTTPRSNHPSNLPPASASSSSTANSPSTTAKSPTPLPAAPSASRAKGHDRAGVKIVRAPFNPSARNSPDGVRAAGDPSNGS